MQEDWEDYLSRHHAADADRPPVEEPVNTWAPVELGPYVRGEKVRPEPTVGLCRTDGLRLIYPGKEHTVIGEMECGKSWFSLACCAAEMTAQHPVLYIHFEEADPSDSVERLQALGVPDGVIVGLFHFVAPESPVREDQMRQLLEVTAPSLVVLDGVNEGMALHSQGIRDEDGVAAFRRRLIKPCTATGAAVLGCDHVVKDKESRGRYALGSIHKGNALSGSLILLESADPFGRGLRGRSHVYVTKDRPGHLRRNGRATKTPGKTFMGELVVDDTRTRVAYLDLAFWAPSPETEESPVSQQEMEDESVLATVVDLGKLGKPANVRNIRAVSSMSHDRTDNALARLVLAGQLIETAGPKNSRQFSVPEDQHPES